MEPEQEQDGGEQTSVIIGLATAIRPIPPVTSRVEVENSSQNWK